MTFLTPVYELGGILSTPTTTLTDKETGTSSAYISTATSRGNLGKSGQACLPADKMGTSESVATGEEQRC